MIVAQRLANDFMSSASDSNVPDGSTQGSLALTQGDAIDDMSPIIGALLESLAPGVAYAVNADDAHENVQQQAGEGEHVYEAHVAAAIDGEDGAEFQVTLDYLVASHDLFEIPALEDVHFVQDPTPT
jgi:hypothetical protein